MASGGLFVLLLRVIALTIELGVRERVGLGPHRKQMPRTLWTLREVILTKPGHSEVLLEGSEKPQKWRDGAEMIKKGHREQEG